MLDKTKAVSGDVFSIVLVCVCVYILVPQWAFSFLSVCYSFAFLSLSLPYFKENDSRPYLKQKKNLDNLSVAVKKSGLTDGKKIVTSFSTGTFFFA